MPLGLIASAHEEAGAPPSGVAFKTALGSQGETASGSTIVITTTAAIAVDDLVVVRVAADNLGATTPTFTATDSGGNAYKVHQQSATQATAAAGIAGGLLATKATSAVSAGGTITVTLSGAVAARVAAAESFTGADNNLRSMPVGATATNGAVGPITSGTVNSGDLVLGWAAIENNAVVISGDSDTLNGSWSAIANFNNAAGGTAATRVQVGGQYKIVTAAGAQTWAASGGIADCIGGTVVLQTHDDPVAPPTDPFAIAPWTVAFWAEDPAVTPPANGAVIASTWNLEGTWTANDWARVGSPTFISSWMAGRPAVNFAVSQRLTADFQATATGQYTVALVAETTTAESDLLDSTAATGTDRMVLDRVTGVWRYYRDFDRRGTAGDGFPHLFILRMFDDASDALIVDGTSVASGACGNRFGKTIALGSTSNNTDHVTCKIAFAGLITGELDSTQRANLLAWFLDHY